jgi:hypothetical protein
MKRLLVIEDGDEYTAFARALLADRFAILTARSAAAALEQAGQADLFLVDLRFERTEHAALVGDLDQISAELFGGDRRRALRHAQDQQGIYILRALRAHGHAQRAVFVHDFPTRRLENLRSLYGDVDATPSFELGPLRRALGVA